MNTNVANHVSSNGNKDNLSVDIVTSDTSNMMDKLGSYIEPSLNKSVAVGGGNNNTNSNSNSNALDFKYNSFDAIERNLLPLRVQFHLFPIYSFSLFSCIKENCNTKDSSMDTICEPLNDVPLVKVFGMASGLYRQVTPLLHTKINKTVSEQQSTNRIPTGKYGYSKVGEWTADNVPDDSRLLLRGLAHEIAAMLTLEMGWLNCYCNLKESICDESYLLYACFFE